MRFFSPLSQTLWIRYPYKELYITLTITIFILTQKTLSIFYKIYNTSYNPIFIIIIKFKQYLNINNKKYKSFKTFNFKIFNKILKKAKKFANNIKNYVIFKIIKLLFYFLKITFIKSKIIKRKIINLLILLLLFLFKII